LTTSRIVSEGYELLISLCSQ